MASRPRQLARMTVEIPKRTSSNGSKEKYLIRENFYDYYQKSSGKVVREYYRQSYDPETGTVTYDRGLEEPFYFLDYTRRVKSDLSDIVRMHNTIGYFRSDGGGVCQSGEDDRGHGGSNNGGNSGRVNNNYYYFDGEYYEIV